MKKIKTFLFKTIEPIFPYLRDGLIFCKVIRHTGRQRYPIGFLASGKTASGLEAHLLNLGFHKNKIAWVDDGEILGMRKLANFDFCYHIRLFSDGEIRGHYERTVESDLWDHFFEVGMEQRQQEFLQFVGEFLAIRQLEKLAARA